MDPAVVGSPTFGQIFKTTLPGLYMGVKEQIFSQPLVYTAPDGVHADLDCGDISPFVGVTGTGVIDPETGTWYMVTKTYADQTLVGVAQGRPAGRQILHAVSIDNLSERPNFPVDLEGTAARNNPARIFNGGIHHQRPGLLHSGKYIYAGFGSHCVKFNFTGWIMGWDKTTGRIVERYTTLGEGTTKDVSGGSLWMSGGAITSDDKGSMFFSTGNGHASQLDQVPVSGRNPPSALEEAVVHMNIAEDGSLKVVDFWMPWEKKQLDVIRYPTVVFKFSCTNGVPSFIKVADSPTNNAYTLGVGHGTVTSLNDQPGTGLVWTSDVNNGNLRIYKAIPENGLMVQLQSFNIPDTPKFTRPVFGDGRAYVGSLAGLLYGFGSPVNAPLNCTATIQFGSLELNTSSASRVVTCQAKTALVVANITLSGNANFILSGLPTTSIQLGNGGIFTFQAAFKPFEVGPLSSDIIITTSGATGYSTTTPVALRGNGESASPLLQINPRLLSFAGAVTGAAPDGIEHDIGFSTVGNGGPFSPGDVTSQGTKIGAFTFIGLPEAIPAQSSATVRVNFDTSHSGSFAAFGQIISNGGTDLLRVVGVSGDAPIGLVEFQSEDGTRWIKYTPGMSFSFGNVTENTTRSLKLRITNTVGPEGAALVLTVSKPPFAEGTRLVPGESMNATLFCAVPKSQWNLDPTPGYAEWTLNTNDNTGKQVIQFECLGVAEHDQARYRYIGCYLENNPGRALFQTCGGNGEGVGAGRSYISLFADINQYNPNGTIPTSSASPPGTSNTAIPAPTGGPVVNPGVGTYGSVGCYTEATTGRALPNGFAMPAGSRAVGTCIAGCASKNYLYAGLEYGQECWCGNALGTGSVPAPSGECRVPASSSTTSGSSRSSEASMESSTTTTQQSASPTQTRPSVKQTVGAYVFQGCYTEAASGRALSAKSYFNDMMTLEMCAMACAGFQWFGVEYKRECYCGNALNPGSGLAANQADCNLLCPGDPTTLCGAGVRLQMYKLTSQSSTSIFSTSSSLGSVTTLSISSPTTIVSTDTLSSSIVTTTTPPTTTITSISTSTTTSTSSSLVASSSTATSSSTAVSVSTGDTKPSTGKLLPRQIENNATMTIDRCLSVCSQYQYAGVEYGREYN
ncbi:putative fungistatic metabolite [Glarea lozoyensis 74030]|uniref:Putative fungistatic metabolite n=1 Tax=Glarea lozoyensis (strain ATCC 74030 / MF5533) TaxID=1104152 RepID=H0EM97_GLAL7|nr:putative fungistatic metabolite [Glarea lozoyensis 74030]